MNSLVSREVTPYADLDEQWNDVTINAGASQSTLQDIKLPEVAGCFTYQDSRDSGSICSNRFIYWRTNHDVIELVEVSLDVNLNGNRLRLKFQNTPILRGTSIHEYGNQVVLLIATVSAIHKLTFPHPRSLDNDSFLKGNRNSASIFYDTTSITLRNRSSNFVLNNVSVGIPLPHTSCSWLNANGNATFILANNSGSVLMVIMSTDREVAISSTELMKTGSIFRLFNGIVPTVLRSNKIEVALSIVCHNHKETSDVLIFSLFSDLQLRVWSSKKQDCILVDSILNYDNDTKVLSGNFTAHQCHLRKSATDIRGNFYLGIYVPVPHQKIFYVFQPIFDNDRCKLSLVTILHQTDHDLVDFCISDRSIWTLWLNRENQPVVLTALFDSENKTEQRLSWLPVNLEPRVSSHVECGSLNIQDQYLKEIFKVGRFLPSTISKAIAIFSSSRNLNISFHTFRTDELKKQVIETVTSEIMMNAGENENIDERFVQISKDSWSRFFSYCIQYHEVGMKPLGISLDPKTGLVVIIKKSFFSLLCPCDSLDLLMIPSLRSSTYFIDLLDEDDKRLYSALKNVLACIDLVQENFDPKQLQQFSDKRIALESTFQYASEICDSLDLDHDSRFCLNLHSLIPSGIDVMHCLQFLLKKLDFATETGELPDANQFSTFSGSSYGIGALCAGLSHFAKQRFDFCRNMLLFTFALWKLDTLDSEHLDSDTMKYHIIPNIENLLRSYYIVWWCTISECFPVSASIQDAAFKQFCILELPEFTDANLIGINSEQTVCSLFFHEDGGVRARKLMEFRLSHLYYVDGWKDLFPSLVYCAAHLLWPVDGNVVFPEFLFMRCQYSPLHEYNNLLQVWSPSNKQFLNFLVASSCLILGKPQTALRIFLDVSKEVESESYLCNKWIKRSYSSASSVVSQVCMRILRMLEQFSLSDCIVNFTNAAVNEVDKKDPNIPIFYSILFKHNLNLNRTEEAFATLVNNPDPSRRKDSLRQLIVKLCESKQYRKIIDLSYNEYEDEIIAILESRARCSDLCHNTSFYGVLYALHIEYRKFRKAATVMYELAMRYSREVVSLKGLKKQVSCYLAVINCLHMAEPQYAWIVKPTINADIFDDDPRNSPKRNSDGCEIQLNRPVKLDVLGLPDIIKEYNLVQARLTYVRKYGSSSSFIITPLSAEDTVAVLLDGCLFEQAILLSKSFSLSLVPVFEALSYRCISSILQSDGYNGDEFETKSLNVATNLDASFHRMAVQQHIWNDLKIFLLEHEEDGKTDLHKCVTEKLLAHGAAIPAWLKLSYQKRNFTELLTLYISHSLLEDSIVLLTKYIKAVLGVRKEDFNLKFSLNVTSLSVWLPHTYIDILLDVISFEKDEHFKDICDEFEKTLEEYNKHMESISATQLSYV